MMGFVGFIDLIYLRNRRDDMIIAASIVPVPRRSGESPKVHHLDR